MKVYFETYGCSYNFADTEYMKSLIKGEPSSLKDADIIIINTCTVKNKTINNLRKRFKLIHKENPHGKIIVTGCIPQASKNSIFEISEMKKFSLLGPNNLNKINYLINSKIKKDILEEDEETIKEKEGRLNLDSHKNIEIIPISKGCLSKCTFCQTKLARGSLRSFKPEEILERVRRAVSKGTKIIYLTSQDNGCYGFDFKGRDYKLPDLIKDLCEIKGEFKIRIGMANPIHLKKIILPLLKIMKNEKVFKFLHIPIQSGSNKVLKDMRRGNSVEEYKEIILIAEKEIPKITISTDIIVGFPTETNIDFQDTLNLLDETKPSIVNRAKFSARPGTLASKMKQISTNTITNRSKILNKKITQISKELNEKWINWEGEVIIETKKKKGSCVARNLSYKPIVIKKEIKEGKKLRVKIIGVTTFHLIGEIIETTNK